MDYYRILGVGDEADEKEIRSAFRTLARQYHPDAGEGSSAEKFRQILEAYETLIDPERRQSYDRARRAFGAPLGVAITPVFVRRGERVAGRPPAASAAARPAVGRRFHDVDDVDDLEELFRLIEEASFFRLWRWGW